MDKFNYTMLCDFYELTMGNGYFVSGMQEKISYFDLFFRQIPDGGGFAIACGLEQVINYIENLHFDEEDIEFLRSKGIFDEGFLEYLKDFRFTGDIFAVPEGTVVFPNEPIITVRAPAVQAQLVETYLLLCINHQTLIATKANRIVRAAQGRAVSEFGSRRAHGADAAILGARAAGIDVPIAAGIMPVTNKKQIERMVTLCGASLPSKFVKMMQKYENDPEALRSAGIAYAIDQIVDLISNDVQGIHLYAMNNPAVASRIYNGIKDLL